MSTWDRSWFRAAIVLVVTIKIAGLVLIIDWTGRTTNPFDLAKSLYSRSLEWVLVALLVLVFLRWGSAVVPRTRLHFFIAAIVVVNLSAALAAPQPYLAAYGTQGRYLGLTFIVDMAVLYLAIAIAFRRPRDWAILLVALAASVAVSLAYASVQYAGLDPLPWSTNSQARPFSLIGNPNTYGHLLSVALAPAAATAILYAGRWRWPIRVGAALLACGIVIVDGIVATRGTLLGLVSAMIVVPILFLRLRGSTPSNLARVGVGLALAIAGSAITISGTPLGARVGSVFSITANLDRLLVWEAAARAFAARPVLGYGPDSFVVAWPAVRPFATASVVGPGIIADSAHDWVLQSAATTGALGVAASVAALVVFSSVLIRHGIQREPFVAGVILVALAGYWAHALVSVGTVGVDWVPWVAYGAAAALTATDLHAKALRGLPVPLVAACVALSIAAGAVGVRALDANRDSWRAREATDLRQPAQAIDLATTAVALDGGRADYWNELGRAYFAALRWSESAGAFDEATRRAPHEATYRSNLGRALAQMAIKGDASRGGPDAAIEAARQGAEIDPNEPLTHIALAQVAGSLGRSDVALSAAVDAIVLFHDPAYDALAATAASQTTDTALARRELERAVSARESARLRVALGNVALRQGDRNAALESARRALALEPNNADAQALVRAAGG